MTRHTYVYIYTYWIQAKGQETIPLLHATHSDIFFSPLFFAVPHVACGILVPRPGIKPVPCAVRSLEP